MGSTMTGRPAEGVRRDVRVIFRVLEAERARWQAAADREGLGLSAWMRRILNAAAPAPRAKGKR